nr:hypothetical protein [Nonomuraea candida]
MFIGAIAELPGALAIPALLAAFVALTATALRVRSPEPLPG